MVKVGLLVLFFFSMSPAAAAAPQTAVNPAASAYERLLQRYGSGDFNGAVTEALTRPARAYQVPLSDAIASAEYRVRFETTKFQTFDKTNPEAMFRARDELVRLALAAMLLHTDAAFKTVDAQASDGIRVAQQARSALLVAGGYLQGKPWPGSRIRKSPVSSGAGHFTSADVDRARHDWIVLVAVGFHARSRLDALEKFLADALKAYPRDPVLELCLGVYYERRALADTVDASLVHELYASDDERLWRRRLESAIAAFGEVPNNSDLSQEAHLRVGYSRAVLKDPARARSELEPLGGPDRALPIQYLALLTLGSLDEADGHGDAAEARYRAAMALFPTSQAPMLAMSRLRDEAGDTRGAREWMERSFTLPVDRRVDPWWEYYRPFIDRDALLNGLREQVRR